MAPPLQPSQVTAIIDTREQEPFDLAPLQMESGTLSTGDYSAKGFESHICIERKSMDDLVGCITSGRERFERELMRMKAYPCRAVVIEGSWSHLAAGKYRSRLIPKSATHTICSWVGRFGVPFQFCGGRALAEEFCSQMIFHECKRFAERAAALGFLKQGE